MVRYSKRRFAQAVIALLNQHSLTDLAPAIAEIVIAQKWTHDMPHIMHEMARVLEEEYSEVEARVTSARPLTPTALRELEAWVQEYTQAKKVTLAVSEVPAVIGGARLETETFELDVSVERHLNRLLHTYHAKNLA